jgi:hypothetical protein
MKRIVLHIDHLLLKGFQQADRHDIASGIQQELTRLYSEPHSASQLMQQGNAARLHIGNVSISHGANGQHTGKQIARGISKGIKT